MRRAAFALLLAAGLAASGMEVTGTVLGPNGSPVPSADVWLTQKGTPQAASTGTDGRFAFTGASMGWVNLVARKKGLALGGFGAHLIADADTTIHLGDAGEAHIRIIGPESEPVAGARIKSLSIGGMVHVPVAKLSAAGFPSLRSGGDGRLIITELPKGSHFSFVVSHRRYAESYVTYLPVGAKEQDIRMAPGVRLRGRVLDEEGDGVAKARVSVYQEGPQGTRECAEATTGPEGYYHAQVTEGTYLVTAYHEDYAYSPSAMVELVSGEDAFADLTLPPAHYIEGVVHGPDGEPLGAVLALFLIQGRTYCEAYTGVDGRFRLLAPPGRGEVRVLPPPGLALADPDQRFIPVETAPEVKLIDPVRLRPIPDISGKVLAPDGEPADRVLISSIGLDPSVYVLTDDDGTFQLKLAHVPPAAEAAFFAEHALRFWHGGFLIDLDNPGEVCVQLKSFEPDLATGEQQGRGNNLSHMVGKPSPPLQCDEWFNTDRPVSLKNLKGKVVVLTLWASFGGQQWQEPMRELEVYHQLLEEVGDVAFVGVHAGETRPEDIQRAIEVSGVTFPVGRDQEPFLTFDSYNTNVVPQTVLIDKEGNLRYYDVLGRLLQLIKALRREK